jgi:zinc-ribbon domain
MSTKRYADSESDPGLHDAPTAARDQAIAQWKSAGHDGDTEPMVAPPSDGDTEPMIASDLVRPALDGSSTAQGGLLVATASDRCSNCGAQLAPDQRYCVVCGERRGRARFANAMFSPEAVAAPEPTTLATAGGPLRGSRYPPAATWIAAIAVLLIAVGLGILIGHDSSSKTLAPQPKVNVTVNGGGGSGAASNAGTTASTTASSNRTTSSSSKATKTAAPATKTTASAAPKLNAKQQQTANGPPAGTQVGGACSHGAGCQGGKFTGNFFGG